MTAKPITVEQAQAIIDADREQKRRQELAEAKKHIGKCFRYRNSGGGADERWWLYARVTAATKYGWLTAVMFQRIPSVNSEHRLEPCGTLHLTPEWQEISRARFNMEARRFQVSVIRKLQAR